MHHPLHLLAGLALPLLATGCRHAPSGTTDTDPVRVATFNVSLHRSTSGGLEADLAADSDQARRIAAILQRVRADIVLLAEFDFDEGQRALDRFHDDYLAVPAFGGEPLHYPHRAAFRSNTGEASGLDLDRNGRVGGAGDAWGYGEHPGQYAFAILSRFPPADEAPRTFRELRWQAMPNAALPTDYWSDEIAAALRLSSKSHVDAPFVLPDGRVLHVLASHPTPPVFDGPEDRNGRRNHDEIRFWADYVTADAEQDWIVDDDGRHGGLDPRAHFVVVGDLNADPFDGDSFRSADGRAPIAELLDHPRIRRTPDAPIPISEGAALASREQGGANTAHRGPAAQDTGDFRDDPGPGNLRLDYVLADNGLEVVDCGVFWPLPGRPGHDWTSASDHRLVWVDLR